MIKNPCIFIFLLAIAVSGKAQIPTDSLVAHYAFNNSLDDETGNGFNIFNTDIGFETDRFGNSLGAASFDGINDSLNFPFEVFSPIEGDFAFSLWFRSNNPEVQNLFSLKQFADDTTNNFEFQLSSHNRYYLEYLTQTFYQVFAYWNGTGQSNNAIASGFAGLLTNGKWHHMVFTRQGEVFGLYVDGQEYYLSVDNSFGDILGDGSFPVFGASPYRFKGALDDLRFYNKALSAWEVAQLWFEDRPLVFSTPERNEAYVQGSELLAYWDFDDVVISDSVTVQYRVDGGPW
ncbi:MAG: LamG domain-containing protein, partial [Flavobacteriales bacterium]|nr:LamG domain-containing protein [Flavobacteriales bacterium]